MTTDKKSPVFTSLNSQVPEKSQDAYFGEHESWCDCINNISELCNCLACGYIQDIEALQRKVEELQNEDSKNVARIHSQSAIIARLGKELEIMTNHGTSERECLLIRLRNEAEVENKKLQKELEAARTEIDRQRRAMTTGDRNWLGLE